MNFQQLELEYRQYYLFQFCFDFHHILLIKTKIQPELLSKQPMNTLEKVIFLKLINSPNEGNSQKHNKCIFDLNLNRCFNNLVLIEQRQSPKNGFRYKALQTSGSHLRIRMTKQGIFFHSCQKRSFKRSFISTWVLSSRQTISPLKL